MDERFTHGFEDRYSPIQSIKIEYDTRMGKGFPKAFIPERDGLQGGKILW